MLETFHLVKEFPAKGTSASGFPLRGEGDFAYIIHWVNDGNEVPFYVGQTGRLNERIDDYCAKHFQSPTDFRVGEAVCYLRDVKGFRVVVRYKPSLECLREEYLTIRHLQTSGVRLLNDLLGYNYTNSDQFTEREVIHKFCDVLIRSVQ